MESIREYIFSVLAVLALCYAIYWVWQRFEAERERQRVITHPQTVARMTAGQLKKTTEDKLGGYLPEVELPYHYYQQGELREGTLLAPGELRLRTAHALPLAQHLQEEKNFMVHIDPDGKGRPFLTPGPGLISWGYLLKLVAIVAVGVLMTHLFERFFLVLILFLFYPDLITSNFSTFYPEGLKKWLKPAREELVARPQVQKEVVESMPLPEAIALKEKLPG